MEIFNHIIKNDEIIGIGPLMIKYYPSQQDLTRLAPASYYFVVHLRTRELEIGTEKFDLQASDKEEKIAVQKLHDETNAFYNYARKQISLLVNGEKPQPKKPAIKKTARKK